MTEEKFCVEYWQADFDKKRNLRKMYPQYSDYANNIEHMMLDLIDYQDPYKFKNKPSILYVGLAILIIAFLYWRMA